MKTLKTTLRTLLGVTAIGIGLQLVARADAYFSVTTNEVAPGVYDISVKNVTAVMHTFTTAFRAEDGVNKVTFLNGGGITYAPSAEPTYRGGTDISGCQLYVTADNAFGTGPVRIGDDSMLLAYNADVLLTNKVIVSQKGGAVVGYDSRRLTLRSIGTPPDGTTHFVRIGRTNAGAASTATLALSEADSEAIDQIRLYGQVALTLDKGTVRMRSDAKSPFFRCMTGGDTADVTVSPQGTAFDVPAEADVDLGTTLKFASCDAVVETYSPPNASFEEGGLVDWTVTSRYNEGGGVYKNGSAFDTSGSTKWTTPCGDYYVMVRRDGALSTQVDIPTSGRWRITYQGGCRPGGDYSVGMATTIRIDGVCVAEFPAETSASKHAFRRFETGVFDLEAGVHTLTFAVGDSATASRSLNFDAICFERLERLYGSVVKTGAGRLAFAAGQALNHVALAVEEGALALSDATLASASAEVGSRGLFALSDVAAADTSVAVGNGGVLALTNVTANGLTVDASAGSSVSVCCCNLLGDNSISVDAGGTLTLGNPLPNLVSNGSFEEDGPQSMKAMNPAGWTTRIVYDTGYNSGGNGLQCNGGTVSGSGPYTTAGTNTVYMRDATELSQTVTVAVAGEYELSLVTSCRKGYDYKDMSLSVAIDGTPLLSHTKYVQGDPFVRLACKINLEPGPHALTIGVDSGRSVQQSGPMVFVDDIRLMSAVKQVPLGSTVRMASGSTLRLDNTHRYYVADFLVDGVRVSGRRSELARAGVMIVGDGRITVGDELGFVLIFK